MKKLLLSISITSFAFFTSTIGFSQNAKEASPFGVQRCGTMEHLAWMKQQDPGLQARMDKVEADMQQWMKNHPPTTNSVVTIPVVFHVIWFTAAEKISATNINAQVAQMNKDYHKLNTDWTNTPSVFQSAVGDLNIQFCLASKDPSGNATTGIDYVQETSDVAWTTDDKVKSSTTGGANAWDATKYLNIWFCNLGSGLLGYSQFPGGPTSTDGCVILYSTYPGGTCCSPDNYHMGRTITHEVGHWLNLIHIWGDANCGNDQVADTPTQQTANYGCPTFQHVTCSNGPNGDMFMNYMDYVDDNCMVMFSNGQGTRANAAINTYRSGLLTSAASNCTAVGIPENTLSENISIYPNPSSNGEFYMDANLPTINNMEVTIFNVVGESVMTKNVAPAKEIKFDMNSNPNGVYLIRIKTSEGTITKKIILNR